MNIQEILDTRVLLPYEGIDEFGNIREVKDIVLECEKRRYPTDDSFAYMLWGLTSGGRLGVNESVCLMKHLGYVAFAGFPLVRIIDAYKTPEFKLGGLNEHDNG